MYRLRLILALALVVPVCAEPIPHRWWDKDWGARHRIFVPARRPPKSDAALVKMSTFGLLRRDAADLRVVTPEGGLRPHRVLRVGPGDLVSFLFQPLDKQEIYYAYFDNPRAAAPEQTWEPAAGLRLEVRDLPPGSFNRAREILALWDRARTVQGVTLRPRIFDGANPVGRDPHFIARYVGHFRVPQGGTYRFFTASSDASLVRVDGRVVCVWGGVHHAAGGRNARFGGAATLAPGVHSLDYTWVKVSGHPPASVLAWQKPLDRFPWLMPPHAFLQPSRASAGPIELLRGKARADFIWRPLHSIEQNGLYAVCMRLEETADPSAPDLQFRWEFPHRRRAIGKRVQKVFFGIGPRKVKLVHARGGVVLTGTQAMGVEPVWTQIRPPRGKQLGIYVRALEDLDAGAATPGELAAGVLLADPLDRSGRIEEFWRGLKENAGSRSDPAFVKVALFLGRRFQLPPFSSGEKAQDALLEGIRTASEERDQIALGLEMANLQANALGDWKAALETITRLQTRSLKYPERRWITILRGDVAAEQGQADRARKLYSQAGSTASIWDRKSETRRAAVLGAAQDYVRRKQFAQAIEVLGKWLLVQPLQRMNPRCLLTLGRAYDGSGFRRKAFVLFQRALRLEPLGVNAPRLLLCLADAQRAAKQKAAAAASEKLLRDRFPYSEEAAILEARKKGIQSSGESG